DRTNAVLELNESNNTSVPVAVTVTAPSCALDVYEDDDNPLQAKAIAAEEIQSRNLCDDIVDWVSFTPSTSGMYVADTGAIYLELYQSDGKTRITPHATDMNSRLSWQATAGATYYLRNYNGNGNYQFTVFACTADMYEDDDTSAVATAITSGQTQTRNLCEDSADWAKFDAAVGTTYTIMVTNGVNITLELYNTDGQSFLAWGSLGSGTTKGLNVITWQAPSTGTYYIKMSPVWGFGKSHEYTLSLN
ncbi:MAG TPA: PPC domain-containing protein, partial [Nitrospirota bacterium]